MMVKFRKRSRPINKSPEESFSISKSISSHLLIGNWSPRDSGTEEKASGGFELFHFLIF
jgi:hypothetical protein